MHDRAEWFASVTKAITLTVDVGTDPAAKSQVVAFVTKGKI
jgi:hypothetical protein